LVRQQLRELLLPPTYKIDTAYFQESRFVF
jgi:hypothetical protein